MDKKIFTFLAAAAVGGLGVVNAQIASDIASGAKYTSALKQGALYHVGDDAQDYIFVKNDTLKWGQDTILANGLWCVKAEKPVSSTYPEFTFENKGAQNFLSVDLSPYSEDGLKKYVAKITYSDVSTWKFSSKYQNEMDATDTYLMSYLPTTKDSVAVLSDSAGVVYVNIVKAPELNVDPQVASGHTLIKASLHSAAPIVLTAEMFNTLFGSTTSAARKLNYIKPDLSGLEASPFTDAFLAEDVNLGVSEYLLLKDKATASKYLRVDTTVYNQAGNPYLKFAYSAATQYNDIAYTTIPKAQHHFRMVYLPSVDSLIINVQNAHYPVKGDNLNNFRTWYTTSYYETVEDDLDDIATQDPAIANDYSYLVVQNLTETKYCLTIGTMPVQLHVGLGFAGCVVADDQRTTLEGLYVIKNAEGKYLQVPIYTDSASVAPQWVTRESYVDPFQMPSFQWVIEKIRTNDPNNISRVTVKNREYGEEVDYTDIQLMKNATSGLFGKQVAVADFIKVPDSLAKDQYLGYKYVSKDITDVTTYKFNYLNELNDSKYLSVKNSQIDSIMYVADDADAFSIEPYHHSLVNAAWSYAPVDYGYKGSLNIAQLKRAAYVLKVKEGSKLFNTNKIVVIDKEKRFAVTSEKNISAGDSAVFYLKTNNTKEGKNYYAFVDTASVTKLSEMITVKAGVADHNLWVSAQNHYELRTSAFAVEENEDPLYRRFNRTVDGIENGADSFYDDVDKITNIRIHRVNTPNEFLYEDATSTYSKNKGGINFLGIKHVADFSLPENNVEGRTTMLLDTAYVNRPAITGAKKDTPKPQYLLAVGLKTVANDTIKNDCEPNVIVTGYTRGRYLINATDSVFGVKSNWESKWMPGVTNTIVDDRYIYNTRWERLVFVDAIHKDDTLYILSAKYAKEAIINLSDLRKDPTVHAINLANNKHKDVVFSFRLIDSEKDKSYAQQVQNFLIESETANRDTGNGEMIAPMKGGWVKYQNGVMVMSRGAYADAITEAEIFNIKKSNAAAVSNEEVDVTSFNVVAGNGEITIQNAAGKTVVVSNILGQTVANTVITSDNYTIAAPKGIVVVAVQGKDAVKAIVK